MRWMRIKALIIKEFLALLRDPRGRAVLIGPPIIQLFLFSYAATLEVTNVDIMVLNRGCGVLGAGAVASDRGRADVPDRRARPAPRRRPRSDRHATGNRRRSRSALHSPEISKPACRPTSRSSWTAANPTQSQIVDGYLD